MKIYIVDSDSGDDQNQHFTDVVPASSRSKAENKVKSARPYVDESTVSASTIFEELKQSRRWTKRMEKMTLREAKKSWADMIGDEGHIP